ncbi:ribonuclease P protein component [Lederbergia citrea]|uniref:Ribonuclease P protein component n=1 Tax=Lederbergia citrea TaxID=2833581 RepID=A0A942Z6C9_9BACI|nr:ribonuclease P protein component [Lederbergia citrea]MBS4177604.1 ribonuclease P protein component [Lederbergia citrea]MBS4204277.1 ribonuclease P protein component [Lederbergia citrea]MBS4223891.1 ribonuclease P protein component [Lederbergia citrea]
MKKAFRIKKNDDFQAVFKKGRSVANRQFVIYILKKDKQENFRIGLSVSKKIGNAVKRNQIKRYIRQAFHELEDQVKNGNDYVIIARKPAAEMDYHTVKKSLEHVLKLGKILKRVNG